MKKKILYLALFVLCLSVLSGGTIAYFTASDSAKNVITTGGVDVTVVQRCMVDDQLQPYISQPIQVMPGAVVSNIVTVESKEAKAWVRMNYNVTIKDADGQLVEVSSDELEKMIVIKKDSESWTFKDGWWYYNEAVGAGEGTKPLFETIEFSATEIDNRYQRCSVEIDINAEAVQFANNGDSAVTAVGWDA